MHGYIARTLTRLAGVLLVLAVGAVIAIFGSPVPSLAAVVAVALSAVQGGPPSPPDPDLLRLAGRLVQGAPDDLQDGDSAG